MFFRRGNIVEVDFVETDKPSKVGEIQQFSTEGIVVTFNDKKTRFIPMSSISEVILVKPVDELIGTIKTQM